MKRFPIIRAAVLATVFSLGVVSAGEQGNRITSDKAKEIGLGQTGGGDVVGLNRRKSDDGESYHLEIVNNNDTYYVEIDVNSGELLTFKKNRGAKAAPAVVVTPTVTPANNTIPGTGNTISYEQALALAFQQTGGGNVVDSEMEVKGLGRIIFEFEIMNNGIKFDVDIDAVTGEIRKFKQRKKHLRMHSGTVPVYSGSGLQAKMSADSAKRIGIERVGGGEVSKYKLDLDNGRIVHEMVILHGGRYYEVEIDDQSGVIIELSLD